MWNVGGTLPAATSSHQRSCSLKVDNSPGARLTPTLLGSLIT